MGNFCCCFDKYNQVRKTENFMDEIEDLLEQNKMCCLRRRKNIITQTYKIKNFHGDVAEEDPNILCHRWYYGKISRTEMFSLLTYPKLEAGTYLVRKPISVNDCPYVLSVLGRRDPPGKFFVKHVKIFSNNNKFYLKHGRKYDTVAELLESYKRIHDDMLKEARLKPDNNFKFSMDPISCMTDKGDVEIIRHVVYFPLTNEAVVELVLKL